MTITYFGRASNPVDNAGNSDFPASNDFKVTPPASMVAGDLVFVDSSTQYEGAAFTFTNTITGGQTWNALTNITNDATYKSTRSFWCQFNGTWTADPEFQSSSTGGFVACSTVMLVFRGTTGSPAWAVDVAEQNTTVAAPGGSFDVVRAGQTSIAASTVTIMSFFAPASGTATWANQSGGAGFANPTDAQFRNTDGITNSYLYKIQSSAAATGSATNRMSANLNTRTKVITFSETSADVLMAQACL